MRRVTTGELLQTRTVQLMDSHPELIVDTTFRIPEEEEQQQVKRVTRYEPHHEALSH